MCVDEEPDGSDKLYKVIVGFDGPVLGGLQLLDVRRAE